MGFSAFWFSHQCHLNYEEFQKMFLKIHKTFKGVDTYEVLCHISENVILYLRGIDSYEMLFLFLGCSRFG